MHQRAPSPSPVMMSVSFFARCALLSKMSGPPGLGILQETRFGHIENDHHSGLEPSSLRS